MRARLAKALVRWVSRYYQASYIAHSDGLPWMSRFWGRCGAKLERAIRPLALRMDEEAATTQMIEEGWWG